MVARAALATRLAKDAAGRATSRLHTLRSHSPLILRPIVAARREPLVGRDDAVARVSLASGAAGPLGGDEFVLEVHVGAASTLVLNEISSTLLLPGPHGGRSRMRIDVVVDDDATFVWTPQPVIAAADCDHVHDITVSLAPSARLFMRDELLLGRHREGPGRLCQTVRVTRGNLPIYHQQLRLGDDAGGWSSTAVGRGHKCIGTTLVVDPTWQDARLEPRVYAADAGILPLSAPAVTITALADDTHTLRRRLDEGLAHLGEPWGEPQPTPEQPTTTAERTRHTVDA